MDRAMSAPQLMIAGLFLLFLAAAHSWLGERRLIGPLTARSTRSGLLAHSPFARRVLRVAWHLTSLAFLGMAAPFLIYAFAPMEASARLSIRLIGTITLLMGATALAASRGKHLSWPFFFAAGLLAITA